MRMADTFNSQPHEGLRISPELNSEIVTQFLLDHLKNANLLTDGASRRAPDLRLESNKDFWQNVLREQTRAFQWVSLSNFQIVDWYPRSPGLFHTESAEGHRLEAEHYIGGVKDGVLFYEPYGKANLIQGGLGAIRFKPLKIEGVDCWLCTATSDGYCHSGIPLAIPNQVMERISFDSQYLFSITGEIRFLPDFLESHFNHMTRIPQIYVLVDAVQRAETTRRPVYITPMVFFTTRHKNQKRREGNVTYVTCPADSHMALDKAASWLNWYAAKYDGEIITNFDQQRPTFENARFSLQNVMRGRLDEMLIHELNIDDTEVLEEAIGKVQIIVNQGEIRMGDTFNMSGDFRGAIINIKSTLTNVNQTVAAWPNLDESAREELQQLIEQLSESLEKVPQDKVEEAEAVAQSAEHLVSVATEEKPNKTMIQITGEGLRQAAENLADVMPIVLTIATRIVTTVSKLAG
jgi:hypothetical protein